MQTLMLLTDVVEKMILLIMIGLSIISVSIMIDRYRLLKNEKNFDLEKMKNMNLNSSEIPANSLWNALHKESLILKNKDSIEAFERSFQSVLKKEKLRLDGPLHWLATLGANTPFIGLFGTILGIIRAFAYLGSQSGSAAVMSGVSQALYATALGLLVAIPAVLAFNYFNNQIKELIVNAEIIKDQWISQLLQKNKE